ncbi:PREDICTED: uncharacterized protein LOC109190036 [Ipomoea nil]|uniref:uncharacterized protein LOC109190036 n=1 Tax=Ipomoea nil TaxID=35883 RepID=UPI00090176B3|nr:PREDICTED: uncharacterized protein LOC109190036 [Ipomoea nil]
MKQGQVDSEIQLFNLRIIPTLFEEIKDGQQQDPELQKIKLGLTEGKNGSFELFSDGNLRCEGRWCVPMTHPHLKRQILEEGHDSPYSVHPGGDKLYQDVKKLFSWPNMKKEVADFVCKYLTVKRWSNIMGSHKTSFTIETPDPLAILEITTNGDGDKTKVKHAFHPTTDGQTERTIQTLEDMLRACMLDFQGTWEEHLDLIVFSYNISYHASIRMTPYEALYGQKSQTPICWEDMVNPVTLEPQYLQDTITKVRHIQERMKAAQDRQKSYADLGRKQAEFPVGEKVWLKVSPTRGVMRFGKKGKLSPRFIGPYEILEKVGNLAYRLALPVELEQTHKVFHVSQLKKYVHNATHVLQPEIMCLDDTLSYEEKPMKILDTKTRETRRKTVKMVKVLWSNREREEATWELGSATRELYPDLFAQGTIN